MPIIKPVSDLRNYGVVLREVTVGQPVFLTKNGHGRYAVLHIDEYREYEKLLALNKLLASPQKSVCRDGEGGWVSDEDISETASANVSQIKLPHSAEVQNCFTKLVSSS